MWFLFSLYIMKEKIKRFIFDYSQLQLNKLKKETTGNELIKELDSHAT